VFNQRHHRHGVYRFLPTAGNDRDHNGAGSYQSVTDASAADAAQEHRRSQEKSAKDGGLSI
jgi:hypothetical protein